MVYELQDISGKIAVITGATSGVGQAIARQMCNQGVKVVLNARGEKKLVELRNELGEQNATFVAGDCSEPRVCRAITSQALSTFGSIDIIIPNAGVGFYGSVFDWDDDQINTMIRTNFEGNVHIVRACAPTLVGKGAGDIIIIASVAGYYGAAKEAVYAGTKHAQVGFAAGLDKELREKGVRVALVAPAGVATNFAMGTGRTPGMERLNIYLRPEEVAAQVVYLARQPASMRTTSISIWSSQQQSS